MEKRRYIYEPYKDYYKTYKQKKIYIDEKNIKGHVSFIKIFEVHKPLIVGELGKEICLIDNGYSEIKYLPDNKFWRLCAMYDNQDRIIEWYFDINKINSIDIEGRPYCDDLYLDIVLMPDGKITILDEDELKQAYDEGIITKYDYNFAYKIKEELINENIVSIWYMEKLCNKLLEYIEKIE